MNEFTNIIVNHKFFMNMISDGFKVYLMKLCMQTAIHGSGYSLFRALMWQHHLIKDFWQQTVRGYLKKSDKFIKQKRIIKAIT